MKKASKKPVPTAASRLLDSVKENLGLETDADLCRFLGVFPPVVAKTRSGVLPVGANMILRLHEKVGMPVAEIRQALAE